MVAGVRPLVLFPDVVDLLREWLIDRMLTCPVYGSRVPAVRPAEFVRLVRAGGTAEHVVDRATVLVESWAGTPQRAAEIAQQTRFELLAAAGRTLLSSQGAPAAVYRVDESAGPADLPDPESQQDRVTFTLVVHVRGASQV